MLKSRDRFVEFLLLSEQHTDEVKTIWLVRSNLGHVAKRRDRFVRFIQVLVDKSKVVRGVAVGGQFRGGLLQRCARGFEFLLAQQRQPEVEPGQRVMRIGGERLLKELLRRLESPLVHVRDAQVVELRRLAGFSVARRLSRRLSGSRSRVSGLLGAQQTERQCQRGPS